MPTPSERLAAALRRTDERRDGPVEGRKRSTDDAHDTKKRKRSAEDARDADDAHDTKKRKRSAEDARDADDAHDTKKRKRSAEGARDADDAHDTKKRKRSAEGARDADDAHDTKKRKRSADDADGVHDTKRRKRDADDADGVHDTKRRKRDADDADGDAAHDTKRRKRDADDADGVHDTKRRKRDADDADGNAAHDTKRRKRDDADADGVHDTKRRKRDADDADAGAGEAEPAPGGRRALKLLGVVGLLALIAAPTALFLGGRRVALAPQVALASVVQVEQAARDTHDFAAARAKLDALEADGLPPEAAGRAKACRAWMKEWEEQEAALRGAAAEMTPLVRAGDLPAARKVISAMPPGPAEVFDPRTQLNAQRLLAAILVPLDLGPGVPPNEIDPSHAAGSVEELAKRFGDDPALRGLAEALRSLPPKQG